MEAETTTMMVAVHKAKLPLMKNESVRTFTRALSDAGRDFLVRKFNIIPDKVDVYMVEVFADKAVFDVFEFKAVDPKKRQRFIGMTFTRKTGGDFEFANTTELSRVTTFQPKKTMITKNKQSPDDTAFVTIEKATAPEPKKADTDKAKPYAVAIDGRPPDGRIVKKQLAFADGWQKTEKNFWNGAL